MSALIWLSTEMKVVEKDRDKAYKECDEEFLVLRSSENDVGTYTERNDEQQRNNSKVSCCKRSTDIVCYSGLNDGFGKKARIGNLRSAGNNDYDIQFSVIGNKSAVISEGLKVKFRSSVAYLLDEFTIAEDPCHAVIFVECK